MDLDVRKQMPELCDGRFVEAAIIVNCRPESAPGVRLQRVQAEGRLVPEAPAGQEREFRRVEERGTEHWQFARRREHRALAPGIEPLVNRSSRATALIQEGARLVPEGVRGAAEADLAGNVFPGRTHQAGGSVPSSALNLSGGMV